MNLLTFMNERKIMLSEKREIIGIYMIKNLKNQKKYIGKSHCVHNRIKTHFQHMEKGDHNNSKLQSDYVKYGAENFDITILKELPYTDDLERYESIYCYKYNVWDPNKGYNTQALLDYRKITQKQAKKLYIRVLALLRKKMKENTRPETERRFKNSDIANELNVSVNHLKISLKNISLDDEIHMDWSINTRHQIHIIPDRKKRELEQEKMLEDFYL